MASQGKKMKPLDDEIARLDAEIARLQGERAGLVRAKQLLCGDPVEATQRKRAPSLKPQILDFMAHRGDRGATTAEVFEAISLFVEDVKKDSVGSILSRLKSEGALVYDGDRYYEKKYAPSRPFDLRVIGS
jgi:hypothetical protein